MVDDRGLQRLAGVQIGEARSQSLLAQLQVRVVAAEYRHDLDLAVGRAIGDEGFAQVAQPAAGVVDPAFGPQCLARKHPLDE